ncbi:sodium-independent anion transporter [Mycolicibacterium agri]|uniref:Sodium-independent anion transporter n=1 Tax=Mycolicibacterium agri TaxID=36811 RepID=A0A7I9VY98_MYCAG|nr:sodium-independent anion transporter [Mycolicibacterium agri]
MAQFLGYERSWLHADVIAGLTVTAYLLPQVMAYATLAGLPAATGLWAAATALIVYAVLGSSRLLSVGPESTTALMTAAVLAPLAAGDGLRYAGLAAALAILVGAICLVGALARLGFLADMLSRPVLVGYMTGIALLMVASQLGKLTGAEVTGKDFVRLVRSFVHAFNEIHWLTVGLAVGVLVLLFGIARWAPKVPGPLLSVLAATAVVFVLRLKDRGIEVVGGIPTGWPTVGLPSVAPSDVVALILPALGIAIVAFSDNMLTARAFASRDSHDVDANAELRALSAANVLTGLTHGFPVSCSASRTVVASASGGKTQMYSLVVVVLVLAAAVLGRGVLEHFPTAALGALVVYAAVKMIDVAEYRRLAKFRRSEFVLAVATAAAVLVLGVLYGVLAAVGLSILDLLRRVAHAHDSVLGFVPGFPACTTSRTIRTRRPCRGLSYIATTRRCASPTRRISGGARWPLSTTTQSRSSGSSSMRRPMSRWT